MKKITGNLLKIALALFIAGAVCTVGAFALSGFSLANLSTEDAERHEETFANISRITVADKNVPVRVEYDSSNEIFVSYCNTNTHEYEITQNKLSDGTLELKIIGKDKTDAASRSWINNIGIFGMTNKTLTITIPEGYDKISLIDIETTNGSVHIDDAETSGAIKVKTTNASVWVQSLSAGTVDISTTNASVSMYDVTATGAVTAETTNSGCRVSDVAAKSITLSSTNGSICLTDATAEGAVSLKSRNSSITAEFTKADSLSLVSTNGSLRMYDSSAQSITAETSNSSISIDGIESPKIKLKTSNGSITGSISGNQEEYSISTKTTNGSSNLKNTERENAGSLIAETTNSKISINFDGTLND